MLDTQLPHGPINLGRFASHFNLSVRYWDQNMPVSALRECELAIRELERLGLPTTCVQHNIKIIKDVMTYTKSEEESLVSTASSHSYQRFSEVYKLSVFYFDRRMLVTAEKALELSCDLSKIRLELELSRQAKEQAAEASAKMTRFSALRPPKVAESPAHAKAVGGLRNKEHGPSDSHVHKHLAPALAGSKTAAAVGRARGHYEGVMDDLEYTRELKGLYATLSDSVRVLPCLMSRFTEDVHECECWWATIRDLPNAVWSSSAAAASIASETMARKNAASRPGSRAAPLSNSRPLTANVRPFSRAGRLLTTAGKA